MKIKPIRLSNDVVPYRYNVHLLPDLEKFTFKGKVTIEVNVNKPTREILLNALKLDIRDVTVDGRRARQRQSNDTACSLIQTGYTN